jgi:adenylate kinase family enzyme
MEVEPFVDGILKIKGEDYKRDAINNIAAAERNLILYDSTPTLTHKDFRDFKYRENDTREILRTRIVQELIDTERTDSDDLISLGVGGAKPKTKVIAKKKLYYIVGPPASGKSTVANEIADATGSYILDSDYAKRKLPEYTNQIGAASLVHEESDALIFNYKNKNLLDYCIENDYNIIIPKIGHNIQKISEFCKAMKSIGYSPYLISVDLDREKATQRAYNRYVQTHRYVPLSLIFDGYGNQPTLNYFKLKQRNNGIFNGFAQITTDVPKGEKPILLEQKNLPSLKKIFGGVT